MTAEARRRVVIIGGGLAGMAAAASLADTPLDVELYEARRQTGGRAGSFIDAASGRAVDYCQHVAMGCCTNFLHLLRWADLEAEFTRHDRLTFLAAEMPPSDLSPSRWLPPPLHFAPAFSRMRFLTAAERHQVSRAMWKLMRMKRPAVDAPETMGEWLRRRGQSTSAIANFWNVVLASALGDHVDRVAIGPARQVFMEGFLGARGAADVLVPRRPLAKLFGQHLPAKLTGAGVAIHRGMRVRSCQLAEDGRFSVHIDGAPPVVADDLVMAVPWHALPRLLDGSPLSAAIPDLEAIGRFPSAPISGIHLWLDRSPTRLPHAVIVGRMSQWFFRDPVANSRTATATATAGAAAEDPTARASRANDRSHYCQVVVSAAHDLRGRPASEIEAEAVADLRAVFAEAGPLRAIQSRVVTDPAAVFSIRPEVERLRPPTTTTQRGLYLAGDWVQTFWPATMEGAVLSGYRAAEAIRSRYAIAGSSLQPPLSPAFLARRLIAP